MTGAARGRAPGKGRRGMRDGRWKHQIGGRLSAGFLIVLAAYALLSIKPAV